MGKKKTLDFYEVTPKLLKKIERLAKTLNITQIATSIGWSRDTFYKKMKEYPDISDAIQRGQTKGIKEVADSLQKSAKGYSYNETHIEEEEENGKIVKRKKKIVKKRVPGNVTAMQTYLYNKDPENYKNRSEVDLGGGLQVGVGKLKKSDMKKVKKLFDGITD